MASIPEPPPKNAGLPVTPHLLNRLLEANVSPYISELVMARHEYGLQKYGQGLMTDDGRDTMEDARQEAGDLLQYVYKGYLQGLKDPEGAALLQAVLHICIEVLDDLK